MGLSRHPGNDGEYSELAPIKVASTEPWAHPVVAGNRIIANETEAVSLWTIDRFVKHHKIKNLIWIWSVDRPEGTSLKFQECWPDPEYVDILSMDCYQTFKQSYYDDLLKLANGKPIALGEVGGNLSLEALKAQPRWTWWMEWAGSAARLAAVRKRARFCAIPVSVPEPRPAARGTGQ